MIFFFKIIFFVSVVRYTSNFDMQVMVLDYPEQNQFIEPIEYNEQIVTNTEKSLINSKIQESSISNIISSPKEKMVTSKPQLLELTSNRENIKDSFTLIQNQDNFHLSRFYLIRASQKISDIFNDQLINEYSITKMICFKKCLEHSCNIVVYNDYKRKCQIYSLLHDISSSQFNFNSGYKIFSLYSEKICSFK